MKRLITKLGDQYEDRIKRMPQATVQRLSHLLNLPDITVNPHYQRGRQGAPGISINVPYGQIILDESLQKIDQVFINQERFNVNDNTLDGLEVLMSDDPSQNIAPKLVANRRRPRRSGSRNRKGSSRTTDQIDIPFEELQERSFKDLSLSNITYDTFFTELRGVLNVRGLNIQDVYSEMVSQKVDEEAIAHYLTYESPYKEQVVNALNDLIYNPPTPEYHFKEVGPDDSFVGRLVERFGVTHGEYDEKEGVLKIGDRLITNIPFVDEKGVFTSNGNRYIPYHIGYFEDGDGSRVDRLRHIDPVQRAIEAVVLQYELTQGDVRFQPLLDVTRNLPDFDNHPFGDEILDTLKRKVVLDKSYSQTNSLLADHRGQTDDLGAVALTMLDDDAAGLIDPYGTSNGSNMGVIFYLTKDAQFNPDGTLTKGESQHSLVGDILNEYGVDKDNFNRNQMSFNAMLTSKDAAVLNVAYAEFALWNSEDAVVLTKRGSQQFKDPMHVGDKVIDCHGNKSVSSLLIDPDMDMETAKEKKIQHAVEFAKLNPEVDMIVSPISLASRMNMGVGKEGLAGEKKDLHLLTGDVVEGGVTKVLYMALPQTAEYKSTDYAIEGQGRKYSNLFRHALASKVGAELYEKGLIKEEDRDRRIEEVNTYFERLGVQFIDRKAMLVENNVVNATDSPTTVSDSMFRLKTSRAIRENLTRLLEDGDGRSVNIDIGDKHIISPITQSVIRDSQGRNILPIRVEEGGRIPYRYLELFDALSLDNRDGLQRAYNNAVSVDLNAIMRKDNILKHINTSIFREGAKTEMIVPDPTIRLGDIRSSINCDRIIANRDPCVQSGNVISFNNVGGNEDNLIHVNPLMINQVDGDFDSDTMGTNSFDNLRLSSEEKDEFFKRSNVYEQLNRYGEVFLSTGGSHFRAAVLANGLDSSGITFEHGASNEEVGKLVEDLTDTILQSPASYGAYALSFKDEQSFKDTLGRIADDGIKGDKETILHHFEHGYSDDENRAVMKALIAKSEWTGLAGAITNNLIAGFKEEFDPELTRVAMDVTYSMTQSVLQMKKNADKLPHIDNCITQMKTVMSGKYDVNTSRDILLEITDGLAPKAAINQFVDMVEEKGTNPSKFGEGLFNGTELNTLKFAYTSQHVFGQTLQKMLQEPGSFDQLKDSLDELSEPGLAQ